MKEDAASGQAQPDKTRPSEAQESIAEQAFFRKYLGKQESATARLMDTYAADPFSETEKINLERREAICRSYVYALEKIGVIDAIKNNNGTSVMIFSSANTGRNEIRILKMLDPILKGKNPQDVKAILADLSVVPTVTTKRGHTYTYKHITAEAIQLDSSHLDVFASLHPQVLCERLGALWHMAAKDTFDNIRLERDREAPLLVALLASYRAVLGTTGHLIFDGNTTSPDAESTWEKMQETVTPVRLDDFLKDNVDASVLRIICPNGIQMIALRFNS
jgi:hypothetical protein